VPSEPSARENPATLHHYCISGLTVASEIPLPSAIETVPASNQPDILLRAGAVPAQLDTPQRSGDIWQSQDELFLLHLPDIGSFLIEAGRQITFQLAPACEPRTASLYLMGTCFAILLQQRGGLVLHASAISSAGRAMLFCGQSGAGKSTLAAMLCQRGHALLNDDVCNLMPAANDRYEVRPDGRMLKLWSQSLEQLQWQHQPDMAIRADLEKYFHAPPASEANAQTVRAIYILRQAEMDEPPSIRRLNSLDGMLALKLNAYRPGLIAAMDKEQAWFAASVALQRSAGIYELRRPLNFNAADSVLTTLEDHWHTLPAAH